MCLFDVLSKRPSLFPIARYPYKEGQVVFDAFNSAFDNLPLVGIIDEQIYCAHGGIPYSVNRVEELYKIPIPLYDPEVQSKPAWEVCVRARALWRLAIYR